MNTTEKLILGAATVVFAAGTVVAIVRPGDLGDDDVAADAPTTTSTTEATTSTTVATTETSTPTSDTVVATTIPGSATTTEAPTTTGGPTTTEAPATTVTTAGDTTQTTVGSGLGAEGSGSTNPDGVTAETGMESMLAPGLALVALALAGRRVLRTSKPA